MFRSRTLLLALSLIPALALAQAQPGGQVRALHTQIAALELDHALALTTQQAQILLPKLQDLRTKAQAMKAEWTSTEPARVAALTQAVQDLKTSGQISDTTLASLKAARPASLSTERQDIKALITDMKSVLTPAQMDAVKTVRLGVHGASPDVAGPHFRGGGKMRHMFMAHIILSDDFLALVTARAK